jgi:uncharacterized protein YkwD
MKTTHTPRALHVLSILAVAAALTACGGGGSTPTATVATTTDSGHATATPTTATPTALQLAGNLVTSVPAPTYAAGSQELVGFNKLNAERERCGFGLLTQNAALDKAAAAHANWLTLNNAWGHYETTPTGAPLTTTPGFTGASWADRQTAAGYAAAGRSWNGESIAYNAPQNTATTSASLEGLLTAPYHELGLLMGYRDVGFASNGVNFDVELGAQKTLQASPMGTVRTYPCQDSTIPPALYGGESPSPVPSRDLLTNPTGPGFAIVSDVGSTIGITNVSMIEVSTDPFMLQPYNASTHPYQPVTSTPGTNVSLLPTSTIANDPNPSHMTANEAYFLPNNPLKGGTTYKVTIDGSVNGKAFTTISYTVKTVYGKV